MPDAKHFLTKQDTEVLLGLVSGRINEVKASKTLMGFERDHLVNDYEAAQTHLLQFQREQGWGRVRPVSRNA